MPNSFSLKGSQLVCEGEGMSFLRLKARLSDVLGVRQIKTLNAKSFSLSVASAASVAPLFREILGSIPDALAQESNVYDQHTEAREVAVRIINEEITIPFEAPWPETLDPAQAVAVSAMITSNLSGLCLFDEQGIGKTVTAIAAFDTLSFRREVDSLVIICPVTMKEDWKKSIGRFLPGKYRIVVAEGTAEQKRMAILSPFDVLICNFESVEPLLVPLMGVLGSKKTLLVVDESFNVKNKEAVRSSAIRELRRYCARGFVLCGTPAPNSALDVVSQYDIADNGYTFAGFVVPKDENELVEQISQRIEERGTTIRRLKKDVLPDLPQKHFNVVQVSMTGRQASLYEEARSKLELSLKSMDNTAFRKSLATYFQQRSVLLQICACPEAVDPSFSDEPAKLVALDILVKDILDTQGKKLIVWSFYKASIESIMKRYTKYNPVLLDGTTTALQRAESVRQFQDDPDVRMCVANPAAAGAGVTLHASSDAAYISFSNQAAHFLQSLDRIHRRGQKSSTTDYHLFVCKGTIEEGEVQRLRDKEVRQSRLLGDKVTWPNSLDDALAELTHSHA